MDCVDQLPYRSVRDGVYDLSTTRLGGPVQRGLQEPQEHAQPILVS